MKVAGLLREQLQPANWFAHPGTGDFFSSHDCSRQHDGGLHKQSGIGCHIKLL